MDDVVEETLDLLRVSLPDTIELDAKLNAQHAAVIADPTHIHQLIMNLCRNAEHAMPAGGKLTVALDVIGANADAALSHGLLPAGRYIRLRVEDTGCGMTATNIPVFTFCERLVFILSYLKNCCTKSFSLFSSSW